jgi:outer membrane protein assembly factor BamB
MFQSVRAAVLGLAVIAHARGDDWPEFRGPTGQGHYVGKPLPVEWSTTKNVVWKQPIPGTGWSSPVIWKGRIYLTSAVAVPGSKDLSLQAICVDAEKGKLLWQAEVFRPDAAASPRIHKKNSHASPTPLTDGKRLYVHFGHQGTAALDLDGKVLWRNQELGYAPVHGNGGSPILVEERLIFSCDGFDKQFVVALDAANGKVSWKTARKSEAFM